MKLRRGRGKKEDVADEHLNDLVVGMANDRITKAKTAEEIDRIVERGNSVLRSAAEARKAILRGKGVLK